MDNAAYGKSGSATCVAVKFGEHHAVECLGGINCILTCHGIDNEQDFAGVHSFFDGFDLVHHLFVDGQTACRIDYYKVVVVAAGVFKSAAGYTYGIFDILFCINLHADGISKYFQLVDSGRAVYVAGNKQRPHSLFTFQLLRQLSGECGFTGTLQSGHKDYGRFPCKVQGSDVAAHKLGKLIMDNLDHQFAGFDGVDYVAAKSFLLDCVGESLCHFIVYVGVDKRAAYVLECFCNVYFSDTAFAFEQFETALEPVAKFFEHIADGVVLSVEGVYSVFWKRFRIIVSQACLWLYRGR